MTAFTLLRSVDLAIDVDFRVFKTSDVVPVSSASSLTGRVGLRVYPYSGEISRNDTGMYIDDRIIFQSEIVWTWHLSEILLELVPKVGIGSSSKGFVPARRW